MRKLIILVLITTMLAGLTGCDALQRKFTRKKKVETKRPRIYQIKKYDKKPSPELYSKHYAWWAGWQSELLSVLGRNHKKDVKCIEEIVSNLRDMQNLLVQEKGDLLGAHIDRLVQVKEIISREDLSQSNKVYVKSALEREDRFIKREFSPAKVKDFLIEPTSIDPEL